ncbi:hypothetical protein HK100_007001 [Physocladia obscura]|uniref:FCP1 homology domain-containing protein n=1 Tax=Physocladia obscura TaxID=109957 RepID=A0AAD5XBD9_9FUNG|nr:hypothetical protein HK100_007001 [Physocladia obscura]
MDELDESSSSSSSSSSVSRVSRLETLLTALGDVVDPAVVAAKRQSTITALGFDPTLVVTQVSPEAAAVFAAVAPPLKQLRKQPSSAAVKPAQAPQSPSLRLPPSSPPQSGPAQTQADPEPAAVVTAAAASVAKPKTALVWRSLFCCCAADQVVTNSTATTTAAASDAAVDAAHKPDSSSSVTIAVAVNSAQPSSLAQMSTASNVGDSGFFKQPSTKSKHGIGESAKKPPDSFIPAVVDVDDYVPDDNRGQPSSHVSENGESAVYVLPPQKLEHVGKKCLILDLDETLVHSAFVPVSNADFIIPILIDANYHNVYVLKRPHVQEFLERMAEHFELVVFTASVSNYADPVLDLLDPKGFVTHRLYRQHCLQYNSNYVKDLVVLGRPLEDCIIIDNNPMAYAFQPSNAIPCATWIDDMEDDELVELQPFLIGLKDIPDVRTVLGVDSDDAYDSVV